MRSLPDRPDLDQLRRQARELQRAAAAGDPDATRRLQAVAARARVTLSAAQLALAREHGFASWTRLKTEVERRRRAGPPRLPASHLVRPVASLEELAEAFDLLGAQLTPPITHVDRRWVELAHRFPQDRPIMLVVAEGDRIVGGALAFRSTQGDTGATLRLLGLEPAARGKGLGRRLLETLELEAVVLGVWGISLGGADGDLRKFFIRMGYHGRRSMMSKGLPEYGRSQQARRHRLRDAADDLPARPGAGGNRPRIPGNG